VVVAANRTEPVFRWKCSISAFVAVSSDGIDSASGIGVSGSLPTVSMSNGQPWKLTCRCRLVGKARVALIVDHVRRGFRGSIFSSPKRLYQLLAAMRIQGAYAVRPLKSGDIEVMVPDQEVEGCNGIVPPRCTAQGY
jgi:hypothetical protein